MKKIIAIAVFGLMVFSQNAYSQQPGYISFQYAISVGTGDLGDFIPATSFRGAVFEYRGAVTDRILLGVDFAWNTFYERQDSDSYTRGTQTVTGTQYRYQNELPILVSADYFFNVENAFRPYAGLGIGTMYTERATDMGIWRLLQNPWHFALKPEVGFLYELSYSTSVKVAAKYYWGTKSGELDAAQSFISLSAGLAFNLN